MVRGPSNTSIPMMIRVRGGTVCNPPLSREKSSEPSGGCRFCIAMLTEIVITVSIELQRHQGLCHEKFAQANPQQVLRNLGVGASAPHHAGSINQVPETNSKHANSGFRFLGF